MDGAQALGDFVGEVAVDTELNKFILTVSAKVVPPGAEGLSASGAVYVEQDAGDGEEEVAAQAGSGDGGEEQGQQEEGGGAEAEPERPVTPPAGEE